MKSFRAVLSEESVASFDYQEPPLLRVLLLTVSGIDRVVLAVPRLICDQRSLGFISRDLGRIYQAIVRNTQFSLPVLGDYQRAASAETKRAETGQFERAIAYWHQQWMKYSGDQIEISDMPIAIPSLFFGRAPMACLAVPAALGANELSAAQECAADARVEIGVVFIAAFGLMLRQCTGRTYFPLWTLFPGRGAAEDGMVGLFAKNHILGFDVTRDPLVDDLITQMGETYSAAAQHQDLPLDLLWWKDGKWTCPVHYFHVSIDVSEVDGPVETEMNSGANWLSEHWRFPTVIRSEDPCSFSVVIRSGQGVDLSVSYSTIVFRRDVMNGLLTSYRRCLLSVIENRQKRVSSLLSMCRGITAAVPA
jgi:hypothetical protein